MPETISTESEAEAPAATTTEPAPTAEPKTFDADYVAKLRQESAKYRTEAKANAEAATKLAAIEEAQKSEAERAADRIADLERQTEAAQREALRFKVASKHGITEEDADLFLTGSDEETLNKQALRLTERASTNPSTPKPDLTQGGKPASGSSPAEDFASFIKDQLS